MWNVFYNHHIQQCLLFAVADSILSISLITWSGLFQQQGEFISGVSGEDDLHSSYNDYLALINKVHQSEALTEQWNKELTAVQNSQSDDGLVRFYLLNSTLYVSYIIKISLFMCQYIIVLHM